MKKGFKRYSYQLQVFWVVMIVAVAGGVYSWFTSEHFDKELVLPLTAEVDKPGISLFDKRAVKQTFTLPTESNQFRLHIQNENFQDLKGEVIADLKRPGASEVMWSQNVSLKEAVINNEGLGEVEFNLLPGLLKDNESYVLRITTNEVNRVDDLRLPYKYGADPFDVTTHLEIENIKQGKWATANDKQGNIFIEFFHEPTVSERAKAAAIKSFPIVGFLAIVLFGLWYIGPLYTREKHNFVVRKELLIVIIAGLSLAVLSTLPIYYDLYSISNHGDINRGLIFSGAARNSIISGQLPLWNAYLCGGSPLLGDVESWFLQPFFLITFPFKEILALKFSFTLALFTLFVGFYVWGRDSLRFNFTSAFLFSVVATFSGYFTQHLAEGYYVWIGSAWIPWFLWSAHQSLYKARFIPLAGLFLAFMFGGGTMHMAVYSLLFFTFFNIARRKDFLRSLSTLVLIVLFFISLAAIKLLPVLTNLITSASRPGFTPPLFELPRMLLGRGILPALKYNGTIYRWSEFGIYVGILVFLFALVGVIFARRRMRGGHMAWLAASLVMGVIAFLPIPVTEGVLSSLVDLFRMPSRVLIFTIIGIAILAVYGFEVWQSSIRSPKIQLLLIAAALILVTTDLVSNNYILFTQTFPVPLPEIDRQGKFTRVISGYTTDDERYYKAAYVDFLENRGINGLCRFYQKKPATRAIDTSNPLKPYYGEAFVSHKEKISTYAVQANRVIVKIPDTRAGYVTINQNYYPGWVTDDGQDTENRNGNGLVSAIIMDKQEVTFIYKPKVVYWSMAVSLTALTLGLWWFLRMKL